MALAPSGAYFVKKLDAVGGISDADLASMAFAEISSSAPVCRNIVERAGVAR